MSWRVREAHPEVWEGSGGLPGGHDSHSEAREAHPEVRDGSVGHRRSGRGREAHPKVRESQQEVRVGSKCQAGGPGRVGRPTRRCGSPSRRCGWDRNANPDVCEGSEVQP